MAQIQVLDQHTINQIAAGEVIERPASVVKELVENAIDAGSNAITVEIKEGGISFIRVTDNGQGIPKEEIKIAFLRHATSKIRLAKDLLYVQSLGFRGEALASIAAIAKVELISKASNELTGVRYEIHGGKEAAYEEIGCPEGTTFLIRDLFYNVPARKKFLKAAQTETSYVDVLMQRLALSHAEVSFKFISNGQIKLQTSGNGNLKDIIYHIYGREAALSLVPIKQKTDNFSMEGFVGKPIFSRGNRGFENYFVNGRYIKNQTITQAIEEAYRTFTMVHKYPFTALLLQVDNSFIDVNVHPAKLEVRFRESEQLYQFIVDTIRNVLTTQELIPNVPSSSTKAKQTTLAKKELKLPEPFEKERIQKENEFLKDYVKTIPKMNPYSMKNPKIGEKAIEAAKGLVDQFIPDQMTEKKENLETVKVGNSMGEKGLPEPIVHSEQKGLELKSVIYEETMPVGEFVQEEPINFLSKEALPKRRLIGQVFKTYWLFEYDKQLYILDQHAAHEKINYERFMKQYREQTICSQQLAPPIVLTLQMKEQLLLQRYNSYFKELGFTIESFGGNEYCIHAVPATLYGMEDKEAFLTFLDCISEDTGLVAPEKITDRIATMACKASVKGNQKLSFQEAEALMEQLMELENPYTCPHGRPTVIAMSQKEIEKKFKRIQ